ncbi:unnamed protein product [Mucor hiemalis]
MAEKRAARELAEVEDRKQAEKIRRKAGQEVTQAKEAMEAKEIKKIYDQKRREKEEEKIAKAKIKAQIEQDRKERAAKKEANKQVHQANVAAASAAAAQPAVKKEYTEARLQIRAPGSGPITHTFEANATLTEVYSYLQSQGCTNTFTLSTTFPRKTFGSGDEGKSLKELGLVPSAALVLAYV